MATTPTSMSRYRSTAQAVVFFAMFIAVGGVSAVAVVYGNSATHVVLAVEGLPGLVWLWRGARSCISVEEGGLRVRNPVRSRFVAWKDVKSFALAESGSSLLKLQDGHTVRVFGVQQAAIDTRRKRPNTQEKRIEAELNEVIQRHRSDQSPT